MKNKSKNKTKTNKNKGGKAFSKSAPIVSVVIPAYHAAAYLEQAALSVVNQTYEGEWELLIVDDASDDRTGEVGQALEKKDPRIRYIRQPSNQGVAAARNRGVKEAKGAYVAFLDADDWWEAGKLEAQMALLEKTGMALCCTGRELMAPDGAPVGRVISVPERITYKMLLKTNLIPLGSVVMKKEAAAEIRGRLRHCAPVFEMPPERGREIEEQIKVRMDALPFLPLRGHWQDKVDVLHGFLCDKRGFKILRVKERRICWHLKSDNCLRWRRRIFICRFVTGSSACAR